MLHFNLTLFLLEDKYKDVITAPTVPIPATQVPIIIQNVDISTGYGVKQILYNYRNHLYFRVILVK